MEKLKIPYPIIVEGKYDKIKLNSVVDSEIFITDGFGIFKKEEKTALFRSLAKKTKIIVLTDSDGGGRVIRNFFNSAFDKERLIHLYIPQIEGKEKRKDKPSKAGTLGVEGMDTELLYTLLKPFSDESYCVKGEKVTKTDLYELGISGREDSASKRALVAKRLGFPDDMTANALLAAVNILYTKDEFIDICNEITEC